MLIDLRRKIEKDEPYCVSNKKKKQVDKFYSSSPDSENGLNRRISKKILLNNISSDSDIYNKLTTVSKRIVSKLLTENF